MEDTQQSNGEGSDRDVLTPLRCKSPLRTAVPSRIQDPLRVRPAPLLYCGVLRDGGGHGVTLWDDNGIRGRPRLSKTNARLGMMAASGTVTRARGARARADKSK